MSTQPVERFVDSSRLKQAYINGKWVALAGERSFDVINPATEEPAATIQMGNIDDLNKAVAAAKTAFPSWADTAVETRLSILDRIIELIDERTELLANLMSLEMGATLTYARSTQVPLAAAHIRVARENLEKYNFTEMRGTTAVTREPIGVAGLITPWNWPLYQMTAKVGPALAVGCTIVLKPSELSPLSALAFAQIIHDAGVPAGVFNLVNGNGKDVGEPLAHHPDVDMISFTGSTRAGVLVAQAAATTVKRVGQELGGKSPNILLPDTDFPSAVGAGVQAGMRNNGQSCSAPTRMLVPKARLAEVEKLAAEAAESIVIGLADNDLATHGPLSNRPQFERVQTMIQRGLDEGARCVTGGLGRPKGFTRGFYARPTIFSDVTPDMDIAQQEIFGPVLCLIPYDSVEHAIEIANSTVFGLSAHVQSSDLSAARRVARQIRSGQVLINYPTWDPQAPFGGYKQSGNGREYGIEGLEEYLEIKAIVGFDVEA
ncbi:aldehyde dehydrogenase family protein [Paraglaciecola chathamensis]|uniref:Aldehyde dehydrogenase n=1 Tax=Paraglaciecola chathamensis S18K6 TaxID=1127672 RepID=A0AAV3UTD8_9ALTE|nr:aldehyde dehydrogenase family protein [Paraglaciecola chathamensis]GAC08309.1 aldehyde dehydrogenase [Paraglaciecola chathamensis S18K6]